MREISQDQRWSAELLDISTSEDSQHPSSQLTTWCGWRRDLGENVLLSHFSFEWWPRNWKISSKWHKRWCYNNELFTREFFLFSEKNSFWLLIHWETEPSCLSTTLPQYTFRQKVPSSESQYKKGNEAVLNFRKKPLFSELASGRSGSQWPPEPQDPLPAWFLIITTLPPIQVDV